MQDAFGLSHPVKINSLFPKALNFMAAMAFSPNDAYVVSIMLRKQERGLRPMSLEKPDEANYERVTNGIRVSVSPFYLDEQSDPEEPRYVWAYTVRIDNESKDTIQIRARHWRITDARGFTDEVIGEGVVGEQPVLRPGEGFEYTSGAPLPTPSGLMVGSYRMETPGGDAFDVDIPAFSLDSPHEMRQVH